METKELKITGMTCSGCVAHVTEMLKNIAGVTRAEVSLEQGTGTVSGRNITFDTIAEVFSASKYTVAEIAAPPPEAAQMALPDKTLTTYRPLLLIITFIAAVSALVQFPWEAFSVMLFMRHFMAGFFIVFSFFKLLNIKGFSDSYAMYDLLAMKWKAWGYIYPFIELALGVLYLINYAPYYTNIATIIVLGWSSLGVIKSNLDKKKIKCACLGDVFNLPMSTVTIVEDLSMVGMATIMLVMTY